MTDGRHLPLFDAQAKIDEALSKLLAQRKVIAKAIDAAVRRGLDPAVTTSWELSNLIGKGECPAP